MIWTTRLRAGIIVICAGVLLGGLLWAGTTATGGGAVQYQAGDLSGYPAQAPPKNSRNHLWQGQFGTHYHGGSPEASWQVPWIEEQKREERSWNMLDQMILDVSPYRTHPKTTAPDSASEPE